MTDPKFVLMVQPTSHQGSIWQAILRSQQISVIWESPDVDLSNSLGRLKKSGYALPDLLLIDTRVQKFNPYAICRWSRKNCPGLKILLVNGAQRTITPSEREWAILQGAMDLLPRLQRDRLMSGAVDRVKRVLELLDSPTFNSKALVSALLKLSRDSEMLSNGIDKVGYRTVQYEPVFNGQPLEEQHQSF
ncbi:MAG: response regulator [Leptolyngbyaceae cyanobacterium CRU_2_3]|nr:response regulator [Leptolyngbyaceae cyanobacterium CRU_2_3]